MAEYYNHNVIPGRGSQVGPDATSYYPTRPQYPMPAHGMQQQRSIPRMSASGFLPAIYNEQQPLQHNPVYSGVGVANYQPILHDDYNRKKGGGSRYPSMRPAPIGAEMNLQQSPTQRFLPMISTAVNSRGPALLSPHAIQPSHQQQSQPFYSPHQTTRYPQAQNPSMQHRDAISIRPRSMVSGSAMNYPAPLSPVYPLHQMPSELGHQSGFDPYSSMQPQPNSSYFSPYEPLPGLQQQQQRALSARRLSQSSLHRAQKRNSRPNIHQSQSIASLAAKLSTANGNPKKAQRPHTPVEPREAMTTSERYHLYSSNLSHHVEYNPYTYAEYRGLKSRDQNMKLPAGLGPNENDQWKLEHEKRLKMLDYAEQVRMWEAERREMEESRPSTTKKNKNRNEQEKQIQQLENQLKRELRLQERDQADGQFEPGNSYSDGADSPKQRSDESPRNQVQQQQAMSLKPALKKKQATQVVGSSDDDISLEQVNRPSTASRDKKNSISSEEQKLSKKPESFPLKSALKKKSVVATDAQPPSESKQSQDDNNQSATLSSIPETRPVLEPKHIIKSVSAKLDSPKSEEAKRGDSLTQQDSGVNDSSENLKPKKKPQRRIRIDRQEDKNNSTAPSDTQRLSSEDALNAIEREIEAYELKSDRDPDTLQNDQENTTDQRQS